MPDWLMWTFVGFGVLCILCWLAFGVVMLLPSPPAPTQAPAPHVNCDGCQECLPPSHRPPETTADLPADMQLRPGRLFDIERTAHLPTSVRWVVLGDEWNAGDAVLGAVLEGLQCDRAVPLDRDRMARDWRRVVGAKHSCPTCGRERCNHKGRHRA